MRAPRRACEGLLERHDPSEPAQIRRPWLDEGSPEGCISILSVGALVTRT
jgi:hypothetical protein